MYIIFKTVYDERMIVIHKKILAVYLQQANAVARSYHEAKAMAHPTAHRTYYDNGNATILDSSNRLLAEFTLEFHRPVDE